MWHEFLLKVKFKKSILTVDEIRKKVSENGSNFCSVSPRYDTTFWWLDRGNGFPQHVYGCAKWYKCIYDFQEYTDNFGVSSNFHVHLQGLFGLWLTHGGLGWIILWDTDWMDKDGNVGTLYVNPKWLLHEAFVIVSVSKRDFYFSNCH